MMKEAILVLMCLIIIGCQGKGDIVGTVAIDNYNVVRIFELNKRIFLFGNINKVKELKNDRTQKMRGVICELINGQVEIVDQSDGEIVDAQIVNEFVYLAKNLESGVVEIEKINLDGNSEIIGTLTGECKKFKINSDGYCIFIFDDNIKITDKFISVIYENKFKYVSGFYDEIYYFKNGNFVFLNDKHIYEYRFDSNVLFSSPKDIAQNIYVDYESNELYKIIKIDRTKSEIQLWKNGVFINKFEVNLMLIDRVYKSDKLLFGGSTQSFGSKLCIYSLDGEKIQCTSPRLGNDWPYFITSNREIISYSSKMIQKIKLSDLE
jgi:hypothetical protein